MEDTASQYFGSMVEEYDSLLRRAVPRYDEMIARAVAYMPSDATRILELGCGTGNFTLAVGDRFPGAHMTLVDGSGEMLDCAAARLSSAPGSSARSIQRVETRFEEIDLPPRSFDLVTSCISLHHVEDMEALFRRLHALLVPGGALVYADQMRGRTDASHAINWGRMVDFWKLPGHLDDEEQTSLVDHAEAHDHYRDVISQLRWLEGAGFSELDCVWRNWMWGVISARA